MACLPALVEVETVGPAGPMGPPGAAGPTGPSGGATWVATDDAAVAMQAFQGYIATYTGTATYTLPPDAAVGATVRLLGANAAGGWLLALTGGQTVHFGVATATTSLASTQPFDTIELVCIDAPTTFAVVSAVGNIAYV